MRADQVRVPEAPSVEEEPPAAPRAPSGRDWAIAIGLFLLTCLTSWLVYGWIWGGGSVLEDPQLARDGALYAGGLMAILLAHESGHYVVARRHGMDQSLPWFIPFPLAFGTLGAIIRLRTLPRSRTALLEMGAAGPLAGFVVAVVVMSLGLPGTIEHGLPELVKEWPPPAPPRPGGVLGMVADALEKVLPASEPGTLGLMILANPPLMDLLGALILGAPPGRYAEIHPLTLAGWAGCFLTAMNLLPIGQLDGGHVFNALWPRAARRVSRAGILLALCGGLLWAGWAVWGLLLWKMGAWRSLPVAVDQPPRPRARVIAAFALACFALCFMPVPFDQDEIPWEKLSIRTPAGQLVPPADVAAWVEQERKQKLQSSDDAR